MAYAELICQSNFTFLRGASSPEELVTTAAFLNYSAIAITDECSVAGVVRAHSEIKRHRLPISLIVGSFFCFQDDFCFVLLCPNKAAYAELCRIITQARRRSPKGEYKLAEWDLIAIKHCQIVWLPGPENEKNSHWGQWLYRHHPKRTWLGATRFLNNLDTVRFNAIHHLHRVHHFPVLATTHALFHHTSRLPLQHVLHAMQENTSVDQLGSAVLANAERALRNISKIKKLFPQQWIDNTQKLASQCEFSLDELKYQYPAELVPPGLTAIEHLRNCVEKGIKKRFPNGLSDEIRAVIEKEMTLIEEQDYPYFFLTIHDIVQFAQKKKILYQGRGSAANSVVCYCLEITAVDPRQINVLFERFISKERDEPPDIDVDFEHSRREEIIQYIYAKYGRERTALAATVITFRFKSAFREVGKALGLPESQLDFVIKNINRRDRTVPWQSQLSACGLDTRSTKVCQLVALVEEVVGFPRHLSQHVGGFVISAGPLYELVPVENAAMAERTVIQWDKDDLESLGLLKVDILALGMLTAIRRTFDLLNTQFPEPLSIPFITRLGDDPQVYDMICKADTVGVFQIESRAQMSMLPRLKPRTYYDLVVQIAIVRPGPIQGDMVHPYLLRRHGKENVTYPSEEVQNVLSRTMGVPIFQEQVIQLAMVAAGFTGGEADQLRRAMASWKKDGRIYEFRDKLIHGMTNKGYSMAFAEQLFEQIKGFGGYGFPESHSASFAVLAYVSCWLKYYFPTEFYIALLNSLPMGFYSASQLVQDARRHHIHVLAVCINHSDREHTLVCQKGVKAIRLGFKLVNGLSEKAIQRVLQARPAHGFTNMHQLKQLGISEKDLSALASADTLSLLGGNRFQARWAMMDQQASLPLFSNQQSALPLEVAPNDAQDTVEDYASLSLSLKNHPIALVLQERTIKGLTLANQLHNKPHGSVVHVVGCVTCRQAPGTASGATFFTLEDHTGNMNIVVWQSTARHQQKAYLKAQILQVDGILERSTEGVVHVIAGKLTDRSCWFSSLTVSARNFH
ncbi:error-prone DNA polymerase [Aestuariibacter sp. A3R04]|uniref:error-prone DNA polymerase n=1 Tax=Aestuariibacter sp. A3R04 TaxID=2841571 RepID=UPI001C08B011|nr:error-prone DNA polymerase [Aestuariibacter sp. A3R04]MBU3023872.1 error-prone DNA polymerase [Aestuariibacter sp. A3R04]